MTTINLKIKSAILVVAFSLLVLPLAANAQATLLPDCDPVPGQQESGSSPETCGVIHIVQLLANIFNYLMYLAAFFATLFIIYAGLRMLYWSLMENSPSELEAAKYTLTRAVAGLVIIIFAFVIVNTIISLIGGGGIDEVLNKANI